MAKWSNAFDLTENFERKCYQKQLNRNKLKVSSGNKSIKVCENLVELPKFSKDILTKLLRNRQLMTVDEVICQTSRSIVLKAKANKSHKSFSDRDDVVIVKIFINGQLNELCRRAEYESSLLITKNELKRPQHLLTQGNIVIMSMVGDNKPAPTLRQLLKSKTGNLNEIYCGIIDIWRMISITKFNTSNLLLHQKQWHLVGSSQTYVDNQTIINNREGNLQKLIDTFRKHGLTELQLREGFFNLHPNNFYYGQNRMKKVFRRIYKLNK
jgi:serine/threonine-protein kinase RIO1